MLIKKILLILIFTILFAAPTFAASFNIEPLAKNYKFNSIVTLKITVTNESKEPFNGEVVLRRSDTFRLIPSYSIKVDNLQGTKDWFIRVPQEHFEGKIIASLEEKGKVVEKRIANYFILHEFPALSILYLVPDKNEVPGFLLTNVINARENIRQYAELQKSSSGKDYDFSAYDVIILEKVDQLHLNDEHWQEMNQWIESGGTLILPGGYGAKVPEKLAPAKKSGNQQAEFLPELEREIGINLPRGSRLDLNILKAVEKAHILYSADKVNWIIQKKIGLGSVIAVPVNFSDETFISWQGSSNLWQRTIKEISLSSPSFGYESTAFWMGEFSWILSSLLPTQMPTTTSLVIIFITYVFMVGFGSYSLLRRRDKRGLMWVSVPVLATLFFLTTYLYGASKRSNEVLVAQTGRVTLYDNFSQIDTGIGIFVPRMGDYSLNLTGNLAVPTHYESTKNAKVTLSNNEVTTTFEKMPVWSMQSVHTTLRKPSKGIFKVENIEVLKNKVNFTLTNATDYELEDCFLAYQGMVYYYQPRLTRGETVNINIDLQKPQDIYQILQYQGTPADEKRLLSNLKSNLASNTIHNFKGLPQGGWMISGFTNNEKVEVKVNDQAQSNIKGMFLVRQNVGNIATIPTDAQRQVKYRD